MLHAVDGLMTSLTLRSPRHRQDTPSAEGVVIHPTISQDLSEGTFAQEVQNIGLLSKDLGSAARFVPDNEQSIIFTCDYPPIYQDYQQLMELGRQNKKRSPMVRLEQDRNGEDTRTGRQPSHGTTRKRQNSEQISDSGTTSKRSKRAVKNRAPSISDQEHDPPLSTCYRIVHQINCNEEYKYHSIRYFEDTPQRTEEDADGYAHLSGKDPIMNLNHWLFSKEGHGFVVFREYQCRDGSHWDAQRKLTSLLTATQIFKESIAITSNGLQSAIIQVSRCAPSDAAYESPEPHRGYSVERPFETQNNIESEFYSHRFFYHHRERLFNYAASSHEAVRGQVLALLSYIELSQGSLYTEVDELIKNGKIKGAHLEMLFCPNDVIFTKDRGNPIAYVLRSWPVGTSTIFLDCWSWGYDGCDLRRKSASLTIMRPPQDIVSIQDLEVYPLQYANSGEVDRLRARGLKFWGLRHQSFVTYSGWDTKAENFYASIFPVY